MANNSHQKDAIDRACSMKEELMERIERLGDKLPPNTLDQLIDELGGPENVAEVNTYKDYCIGFQFFKLFLCIKLDDRKERSSGSDRWWNTI